MYESTPDGKFCRVESGEAFSLNYISKSKKKGLEVQSRLVRDGYFPKSMYEDDQDEMDDYSGEESIAVSEESNNLLQVILMSNHSDAEKSRMIRKLAVKMPGKNTGLNGLRRHPDGSLSVEVSSLRLITGSLEGDLFEYQPTFKRYTQSRDFFSMYVSCLFDWYRSGLNSHVRGLVEKLFKMPRMASRFLPLKDVTRPSFERRQPRVKEQTIRRILQQKKITWPDQQPTETQIRTNPGLAHGLDEAPGGDMYVFGRTYYSLKEYQVCTEDEIKILEGYYDYLMDLK